MAVVTYTMMESMGASCVCMHEGKEGQAKVSIAKKCGSLVTLVKQMRTTRVASYPGGKCQVLALYWYSQPACMDWQEQALLAGSDD